MPERENWAKMKSVSAAADKKVTCVYGIFGSHERRAWGRANGVDIVAIQYETRIGQRIDIGRGNLRRATEAHIVEALQKKKRERQIKQQLFFSYCSYSLTRSSASMKMMWGCAMACPMSSRQRWSCSWSCIANDCLICIVQYMRCIKEDQINGSRKNWSCLNSTAVLIRI